MLKRTGSMGGLANPLGAESNQTAVCATPRLVGSIRKSGDDEPGSAPSQRTTPRMMPRSLFLMTSGLSRGLAMSFSAASFFLFCFGARLSVDGSREGLTDDLTGSSLVDAGLTVAREQPTSSAKG